MSEQADGGKSSGGAPAPCAPGTSEKTQVRTRDSRARDVVVTDFSTVTRLAVETSADTEDTLRLFVVRRGAWTLRYGRTEAVLDAGRFTMRRSNGLNGYEMTPHTSGVTIGLPPEMAEAMTTPITGPAATPEVRLLLAHASLLHETIGELAGTGVEAARSALIELARGVAHRYVDDAEPALVPALVRAARELADQRLAHPELAPRLLARELHVSVRTLTRAFTSTAEPVGAYIRRRRLEEARRELAAGYTVSQVAARWQFADSSHFVRAFRKNYGETPAGYSRSRG
ncbi:helix-turn-helix domain-containing protein [Amycolatopsis pigmentata]|uniref:Helix-turn-helix domain-containing protein n=1 Tax=Amycolatopsis pigmentata TaxID=450801 RepID=A0ABW5FNG1_9PSEU